MRRTIPVILVLAFPVLFAGCDRKEVTSSESLPAASPDGQPGTGAMSAPVGLPDIVQKANPLAQLSDEDNAKFEAWCKRFALDPKDPLMLDADPDRDGFNNREEYVAGTNPLDPTSVPGMLDGVVMKEMKEVQVPALLRGVKDGKAQVQRLDTPGMEEWEQGTVVKGLPYRVTAVKHEVKADKHGVFSDISRVILENQDTKEAVTLVRDLPARTSETHAIITVPGGGEQKIHVDEIIEIAGQKGKKFKVLELRPEQVVIEELDSRRPMTIPKR